MIAGVQCKPLQVFADDRGIFGNRGFGGAVQQCLTAATM